MNPCRYLKIKRRNAKRRRDRARVQSWWYTKPLHARFSQPIPMGVLSLSSAEIHALYQTPPRFVEVHIPHGESLSPEENAKLLCSYGFPVDFVNLLTDYPIAERTE